MIKKNKKSRLTTVVAASGLFVILVFSAPVNAEEPQTETVSSCIFKNPFAPLLPKKLIETKVEVKETPQKIIEAPVKPPNLNISGIVWNTNRPQAIINSYVVGIGDKIANVTIIDIIKSGVAIEFQGKRFIIHPEKDFAEPLEQIN